MGKQTGIAWTRSTFNPWIGCTEVSPGCDHCYARQMDARFRYGGAAHWGAGVPRYRTTAGTWATVRRWDRAAALEQATGKVAVQSRWRGTPGFWPVFPSLCDPFDNEVPQGWRDDFFILVSETPHLTWLLLTKRIGNVARMLPVWWEDPEAWGLDTSNKVPHPNIWIGASVVNQEEADRDIHKLLDVPAAKHFVSYEPALARVDWCEALGIWWNSTRQAWVINGASVDQIIVGGESDQGEHRARPFDLAWARSTVEQCRAAGVACFVKQLGSHPVLTQYAGLPPVEVSFHSNPGADPSEWPEDLRIQEFPR